MDTTASSPLWAATCRTFGRVGELRYRLANRLFGWAVKHKYRPWIRQIPNALSVLRVWAPATSARAIRAYRRRDWQAFALWSSLTLVLIAIDALDGPVAELLDARSRAGAYIDSTMDKFAFLRILRQLHAQLRTHEQGMEAFLSGLAVSWRTYLDLGLQAASTEASLRGFNNKAHRAGKAKFVVDVTSLVAGYAAMVSPAKHRTKLRRLHRSLIVAAICLAVMSLQARLRSRRSAIRLPASHTAIAILPEQGDKP